MLCSVCLVRYRCNTAQLRVPLITAHLAGVVLLRGALEMLHVANNRAAHACYALFSGRHLAVFAGPSQAVPLLLYTPINCVDSGP